jgi:hypothetical protein
LSLAGVDLLLVTPTQRLNEESRWLLLASLEDMAHSVEIPVLELVTSGEKRRQGESQAGTTISVPWPCSIEELKRRIENALPWTSRRTISD